MECLESWKLQVCLSMAFLLPPGIKGLRSDPEYVNIDKETGV